MLCQFVREAFEGTRGTDAPGELSPGGRPTWTLLRAVAAVEPHARHMDSKSSKGGLSPFVSSRERPGATTERKGVRHLVQQLAGRENNHHRRDKKILPAAAKNLEEVLSSALGRLPLPAPEASARSLRLLLTAPFRR